MKNDIEIRFKREWRSNKSYDDSDYVTNDKYINGSYYNYEEDSYYEKRSIEDILRDKTTIY